MTHHRASPWSPAALLRVALLMLLVAVAPLATAQAARDFDHVRTGFPLTGQHRNERCESCHLDGLFKGTPRDCASCHTTGARWARGNVVKPQNHVPTLQTCDTCHTTQSYSGARFSHLGLPPGTCATCHNGNVAAGKNTGHLLTAAACDTCHRSSAWVPAMGFDHNAVTPGTCATCHNGARATGKNAQHVPVGAQSCDACHRSGGGWRPSSFNHTQGVVTNQCSTCHSGAYPPADGRNATHIPYQMLTGVAITNCDSCHKTYVAWAPTRLHGALSVSTQCAACHTGSYPPAVGRPNTAIHAGVTVCESCHKSAANWTTVTVAHSPANAVGTGTCDTCHNGGTAKGKPATHIPVTTGPTKCDGCHRSQSSWTSATTMNHTIVATATCKSCHSGAYVSQGNTGALAKPANHIPEATQLLNGAAMDCNACHKGTTTWDTVTTSHNGSLGGGAGWCKGCHQSGTAYLGSMEKKALTHEKKSPPAIDCSESGCHRPLGSKGATYTKWD
jgi:hypothetical protein